MFEKIKKQFILDFYPSQKLMPVNVMAFRQQSWPDIPSSLKRNRKLNCIIMTRKSSFSNMNLSRALFFLFHCLFFFVIEMKTKGEK